jgi:cytosine/creatinine deaminase
MDILIKNAAISRENKIVDIAIANGTFAAIEPGISAGAGRVIDAKSCVVMPAFVEPHMHLEKALLHRRLPTQEGTLAEALRLTGALKAKQDRTDVLERGRRVLEMAVRAGTVAMRVHPDVDPIQGMIGVETALVLKAEYGPLIDLQIVSFPQEGLLCAPGAQELVEEGLRMGAGVVGCVPYVEKTAEDSRQAIDIAFSLAETFGVPIDFHADFAESAGDPRFTTAAYIATKTIAAGMQGHVSLGHMTSLGAMSAEAAKPVIEKLAAAEINVITLPTTDVYLCPRRDRGEHRCVLTPIRALRAAGVNVAYSSNNIRNAFTPFGNADPLVVGNLLAHVAQFGTLEEQAYVMEMATHNAARVMERGDYGLAVGNVADLVLLETRDYADVLLDIPARLCVIKGGRISLESSAASPLNR